MNRENTEKLFNDFPLLYRNKDLSIKESLISFGFECDDGWFNIIYNLSKEIYTFCKSKNVSIEEYPTVLQVKEKFGGLRFYVGPIHKSIFKQVSEFIECAEKQSIETCELCGATAQTKFFNSWGKTLCENCLVSLKGRV